MLLIAIGLGGFALNSWLISERTYTIELVYGYQEDKQGPIYDNVNFSRFLCSTFAKT